MADPVSSVPLAVVALGGNALLRRGSQPPPPTTSAPCGRPRSCARSPSPAARWDRRSRPSAASS